MGHEVVQVTSSFQRTCLRQAAELKLLRAFLEVGWCERVGLDERARMKDIATMPSSISATIGGRARPKRTGGEQKVSHRAAAERREAYYHANAQGIQPLARSFRVARYRKCEHRQVFDDKRMPATEIDDSFNIA